MRIAAWYKMGLTPEEIATQYGHLSLAQVHAALAYYHANPEEIEADLAQEEAFAESVDRDSEFDPRSEPNPALLRRGRHAICVGRRFARPTRRRFDCFGLRDDQ